MRGADFRYENGRFIFFGKVEDSARYDYEKGMPAAHTLFQVKSLALIAHARKVGIHLQQR